MFGLGVADRYEPYTFSYVIFLGGSDLFYSTHWNVYVTCGIYWIDNNENKVFLEDLT